MIRKELQNIVEEGRNAKQSNAYIRNLLKEYLQVHILFFVYTSRKYRQNLIFTGGTCLQHFFGLERLSEDLDFDILGDWNVHEFVEALKTYFISKQQYADFRMAVKQQDKQVLLKFPVLKELGLARGSESDWLHVRIDLSEILSKNYSVLTTSKSSFGMNYAAVHYDLPSLMAGKVHAVLTRRVLKGKEDRATIKGRDFFDLLWFVKEGVRPNLQRLSDLLAEEIGWQELERRADERVFQFLEKHKGDFEADMAPLIKDPAFLKIYIDHYREEYLRFKERSFQMVLVSDTHAR